MDCINDRTHQMVLANRGSSKLTEGLINQNSDWKTNFEKILGGQIIVGQQGWNNQATHARSKNQPNSLYSSTAHS